MTNRQKDTEKPKPSAVLRESDNPIVEEFKEDLLYRPSVSARPAGSAAIDAEKMAHLEELVLDLEQRVAALEERIGALEGRK
jgi:hypothetical protein